MKLYEPFSLIFVGIIVAALVVGIASYTIGGMKEDNAIEEISEDVIKQRTGIDVDLSPNTPEYPASNGVLVGRAGFWNHHSRAGSQMRPFCNEFMSAGLALGLGFANFDDGIWFAFCFEPAELAQLGDEEFTI